MLEVGVADLVTDRLALTDGDPDSDGVTDDDSDGEGTVILGLGVCVDDGVSEADTDGDVVGDGETDEVGKGMGLYDK